jgi:hypothetical protein
MKQDVAAYIKYYNLERLNSSNGDQSPIEFENSFKKVSVGLDQNTFWRPINRYSYLDQSKSVE